MTLGAYLFRRGHTADIARARLGYLAESTNPAGGEAYRGDG